MNSNESLATKSDERLSTADVALATEHARGHHEESTEGQRVQVYEERATSAGLFEPGEAQRLRTHWTDIQAGFVDEPRRAVTDADALVAEAIKRLAEVFANERSQLEHQWDRGDNVTTEDLRQALRRYRAFFDRLLSV